jgi:hypothetical protein
LNRIHMRFRSVRALPGGLFVLSGLGLLGGATAFAERPGSHPAPPKTTTKAAPKALKPASAVPVTAPVKLAYQYKAGETHRYKVNAIFNGHFPPFAAAGGKPIHIQALLDYVTTVQKVDDKGAVVEFKVVKGDLNILEDDPGPNGKVDPEKVAPFPLPLEQIQKTFNVIATLLPDGKVTDIKGGDTSTIKIDLGIDLRKLFLVTAPMIFANKAVAANDTWDFDDGLLGHKPGKVAYTGRLISAVTRGKNLVATVGQRAESTVDSKLDKEGNSTDKADAAVGTLKGKVTLTGNVKFVAPTAAADAPCIGRVTQGRMEMNALLTRVLPDPDKKGKQVLTDIDIQARLIVDIDDTPAKPAAKTAFATGK